MNRKLYTLRVKQKTRPSRKDFISRDMRIIQRQKKEAPTMPYWDLSLLFLSDPYYFAGKDCNIH